MAQAEDIIFRFGATLSINEESKRVSGAGEHKILQIQMRVRRTGRRKYHPRRNAAPDAQHVHVGIGGALN